MCMVFAVWKRMSSAGAAVVLERVVDRVGEAGVRLVGALARGEPLVIVAHAVEGHADVVAREIILEQPAQLLGARADMRHRDQLRSDRVGHDAVIGLRHALEAIGRRRVVAEAGGNAVAEADVGIVLLQGVDRRGEGAPPHSTPKTSATVSSSAVTRAGVLLFLMGKAPLQ